MGNEDNCWLRPESVKDGDDLANETGACALQVFRKYASIYHLQFSLCLQIMIHN